MEFAPSVLVADKAEAISNGFQAGLGEKTRVNCWFHVMMNVKKIETCERKNCETKFERRHCVHSKRSK